MIKIDKKVKLPPPSDREGKYPWDQMNVGDSFSVSNNPSIRACASYAGNKRGWRFTCRKEGRKIRVWRVK